MKARCDVSMTKMWLLWFIVLVTAARAQEDGLILRAASRGNLADLQDVLDRGISMNYQDKAGASAIYVASLNNQLDFVRELIARGANINIRTNDNHTPIWAASNEGNTDIVTLLALKGADVNIPDSYGMSPLFIAAREGRISTVKVLTLAGADVSKEAEGIGRNTALHIAAQNKNTEMVMLLLKAGASKRKRNGDGWTPGQIARASGFNDLADKIANFEFKSQTTGDTKTPDNIAPLWLASSRGNTDMVLRLALQGADVNVRGYDDITPLFIAAQGGHTSTVKVLLLADADVNLVAKGAEHNTALHIAAGGNHSEIAMLLLNAGADKTKQNANSKTPADVARRWKHNNLADKIDNFQIIPHTPSPPHPSLVRPGR